MVTVLMSTYNGEKFVRQQIDSILNQSNVDVRLVVRDDGSKDGTTAILDEYQSKGLLRWYTGDNLGSARSFMTMLADNDEGDYFAFADQDDYWQPEKLEVAIRQLEGKDGPALYFGQPQPADASLNPVGECRFNPLNTFGESLVYWFAMGCTMVMNRKMRDILVSYTPQFLYMHDVWIYSVAHAVDAYVAWDAKPHMLNRQHGGNVVGINASPMRMLQIRMKRFLSSDQVRYRQAQELSAGFSSLMNSDKQSLLQRFIYTKKSLRSRLSLLTDRQLRCQDKTTMVLFRINLLFNKY